MLMLPVGHRLHVVLEGISRGFTAVKTVKTYCWWSAWWR